MDASRAQAPEGVSSPPQGQRLQLSAASQQIQHSQAPRTRQVIKPPMGWTHDHSEVHLGQALSGRKRPPGPGRCLQVHFRGPKVQLSAESQQSQRSQSSHAQQKIKPPLTWAHFHSKTNFDHFLIGCPQPAGPRRCLQVHFRGPKFQVSATSQQNQHSQQSCTRQKIKPPMGWIHFHSKTNLEQSLSGCPVSYTHLTLPTICSV